MGAEHGICSRCKESFHYCQCYAKLKPYKADMDVVMKELEKLRNEIAHLRMENERLRDKGLRVAEMAAHNFAHVQIQDAENEKLRVRVKVMEEALDKIRKFHINRNGECGGYVVEIARAALGKERGDG